MPKFYRQNRKRIDPRYFLNETIEKQDNEINEQLPFGISPGDALNVAGQGIGLAQDLAGKMSPQMTAITKMLAFQAQLGRAGSEVERALELKSAICNNQGKLKFGADKLPNRLTMAIISRKLGGLSRQEERAFTAMLKVYNDLSPREKQQVFGNIKKLCSTLDRVIG